MRSVEPVKYTPSVTLDTAACGMLSFMVHPSRDRYVTKLNASHARQAAQLHIAGQPGTFLTALGEDVLTVVYRALPASSAGFGVAALGTDGRMLGFVSATTSTGALFANVALAHGADLLPALARALLHDPTLCGRMLRTALYPFQVAEDAGMPVGELLSIMVAPEARGMGIGGVLLGALVSLCQARGVRLLDVTVDAANQGARRFYAAHGFRLQKEFVLYGRPMCQYAGSIPAASVSRSEDDIHTPNLMTTESSPA